MKDKKKPFWVVSINNYICDASYSGKKLKEKFQFPSFRKFHFIKDGDLGGFSERDEIGNEALVEKMLNSDKNAQASVATEAK